MITTTVALLETIVLIKEITMLQVADNNLPATTAMVLVAAKTVTTEAA